MLQAECRDVEGDAGVESLVPPVDPLPQDAAETPLGELVDEAVFLGEGHEVRWLDGAQFGVLPAHERFDLPQTPVAERDLGLIDHVQLLLVERALKAVDQLQLRRGAHGTSVALSLESNSSSTSSRTGFSIGPAMLSPSASPRRNADSRTRRSKPLTISTGPR